jgi:hypothetical protein
MALPSRFVSSYWATVATVALAVGCGPNATDVVDAGSGSGGSSGATQGGNGSGSGSGSSSNGSGGSSGGSGGTSSSGGEGNGGSPDASTGSSSSGSSGGGSSSSSGSSGGAIGTGYGPQFPVDNSASGGFRHPGVLTTIGALNFIKDQYAAGKEPWKTALESMKVASCASDKQPMQLCGQLGYMPQTFTTVICGSHSASPDGSCSAEKADALAAWTDALLWYLLGDEKYAQQAIAIMNVWKGLSGHSGTNTALQCGWVGTVWPRAAEILRYTYPQTKYPMGWADADAKAFGAMLTKVYYSVVSGGAPTENGNWELSTADSAVQIGVYNDDMSQFTTGVGLFKKRLVKYFYLKSADGATPPSVSCKGCGSDHWWGIAAETGLPDGVAQETCRDLEHVQYGLGASVNAAETAKIQGVDLYNDSGTSSNGRLVAAMEYAAELLAGRNNKMPDIMTPIVPMPALTCDGATGVPAGDVAVVDLTAPNGVHALVPIQPNWEIGYNEFANREGKSMPKSLALITLAGNRPLGATHHLGWDTLLGGTGKSGL